MSMLQKTEDKDQKEEKYNSKLRRALQLWYTRCTGHI